MAASRKNENDDKYQAALRKFFTLDSFTTYYDSDSDDGYRPSYERSRSESGNDSCDSSASDREEVRHYEAITGINEAALDVLVGELERINFKGEMERKLITEGISVLFSSSHHCQNDSRMSYQNYSLELWNYITDKNPLCVIALLNLKCLPSKAYRDHVNDTTDQVIFDRLMPQIWEQKPRDLSLINHISKSRVFKKLNYSLSVFASPATRALLRGTLIESRDDFKDDRFKHERVVIRDLLWKKKELASHLISHIEKFLFWDPAPIPEHYFMWKNLEKESLPDPKIKASMCTALRGLQVLSTREQAFTKLEEARKKLQQEAKYRFLNGEKTGSQEAIEAYSDLSLRLKKT